MKRWPLFLTFMLLLSSCENLLQQAVVDQLKLPEPEISHSSGLYDQSIDVILSVNDPDADIRYTLKVGGSVVEEGVYREPITIGGHTKKFLLETFSTKDQALDSGTVSREFNFLYDEVPLPTISPAAGEYTEDQQITIENAPGYAGSNIWYNIPQHPSFEGDVNAYHLYTGPILLEGDSKDYTVNAYAQAPGLPVSEEESSSQFRIEYPQLSSISYSPQQGSYPPGRSVTLTQAEGADLWVTTDGSDPESSPTRFRYSSPISIAQSGETYILKVFAEEENYKSLTSTGTYSISTEGGETPNFTIIPDRASGQLTYDDVVNSGRIWRDFELELSTGSNDPDRKIFYTITTDGSAPPMPVAVNNGGEMEPFTLNGTLEYTGTIPFDVTYAGNTIRINAIEAGPDITTSSPMTFSNYFDYATVPTPRFQYSGGERTTEDQEVPLGFSGTPDPLSLIGVEIQYANSGTGNWTSVGTGTTLSFNAAAGEEESFDLVLQAVSSDSMLYPNATTDDLVLTIDKKPPDLTVIPIPEVIPVEGGFHLNGRVNDNQEDVDIESIVLISDGETYAQDAMQLSAVDPSYYFYHLDYLSFPSDQDYDASIEIRYYDEVGNYSSRSFGGLPGVGFVGTGGGSDTGLSWADAKQDLQEAIDWAVDNDVPELWVTNDPRTLTGSGLQISNADVLRIYGGFRGDGEYFSDRLLGWIDGQTPITRDNSTTGRLLSIESSGSGGDSNGATLIIDGFYFHDSSGPGGETTLNGGAMEIKDSGLVIANCIFQGNQGVYGGALYLQDTYGWIINTAFDENSAYRGGAIAVNNNSTTEMLNIYNSSFTGNTLGTTPTETDAEKLAGSGLYLYGNLTGAWMSGCLLYNAYGTTGYGMMVTGGAQIAVSGTLTRRAPGLASAGGNQYYYSSASDYPPAYDVGYELVNNSNNGADMSVDSKNVLQMTGSQIYSGYGTERFDRFMGGNLFGMNPLNLASDWSDMDKDGDYTERLPFDITGTTRNSPYAHGASR